MNSTNNEKRTMCYDCNDSKGAILTNCNSHTIPMWRCRPCFDKTPNNGVCMEPGCGKTINPIRRTWKWRSLSFYVNRVYQMYEANDDTIYIGYVISLLCISFAGLLFMMLQFSWIEEEEVILNTFYPLVISLCFINIVFLFVLSLASLDREGRPVHKSTILFARKHKLTYIFTMQSLALIMINILYLLAGRTILRYSLIITFISYLCFDFYSLYAARICIFNIFKAIVGDLFQCLFGFLAEEKEEQIFLETIEDVQ